MAASALNKLDATLNAKIKNVTPVEYTAFVLMDRLIERLRHEIKDACEVGCGDGDFLRFFEGYNIPIIGVDISPEAVEIARGKITAPHVEARVEDITGLNRHFDIVFALNVLEHIPDDEKRIETLSHIAKWLVVTVPAHQRLYSKFDKSVGHVRRYDRRDLTLRLEKYGFEIREMYCIGSILFHIYANLFSGNKKLAVEGIREFNACSQMLVRKINIVHRFFYYLDEMLKAYDLGIVYYVLARNRRAL
ncbi:MAG: class I SAM-dependent methyltransferase [Candidatus Omnitrophica bacterium]|nr:class I SAM-dependent methyltransferase [Candidatus Omnitrophota bacterium]